MMNHEPPDTTRRGANRDGRSAVAITLLAAVLVAFAISRLIERF